METQQTPGQEELLDLEAAADRLCVSKTTLYRMLDRGEVKGIKVGRQWRFRPTDLDAYLSRGPVAVALAALPVEVLDREFAVFAGKLAEAGAEVPPVDDDGLDQWEARTLQLFLAIVRLGLAQRASDVHLEVVNENDERIGLVRYRIDGVLHEIHRLPLRVHEAIILRARMLAGGDPGDEGYLDASLHPTFDGVEQDLRVSVMNTYLGDMLTARLYGDNAIRRAHLDDLGFSPEDLARVRGWMHAPSGLILVAGPAGSGKTTLLYKLLGDVAGPERKVATMEDPVEYQLPWVTQVEINTKTRSAPDIFRAFMHHDVDICMVGILKDLSTLEVALFGAETGHLVLAPVTVVSAVDPPRRIIDVFPPEQTEQIRAITAKTLLGVIGMRLVRVLCENCKGETRIPADAFALAQAVARHGGYNLPDAAHFYCPVGCPACGGTGYRGRTGIFEVLEVDAAFRSAILQVAPREELLRLGVANGMRTLAAEGIRKAAEGITSLEEILPLIRQYEQMLPKEVALQ